MSGTGAMGPDPSRAQMAGLLAQQVAERILPALDRAVPVVRVLAVVVKVAAAWCGLALVLILGVSLHRGFPEQWAWWLPIVVLLVVLVLPPIVLWFFARALAELAELPGYIRQSPEVLLDHKGDLIDLVQDTRTQLGERGRGITKLPGNLWRAAKLARRVHGDLPEYGEAIRLVNPGFLLFVGLALVVAAVEVFLVPLLLFVALVLAVAA